MFKVSLYPEVVAGGNGGGGGEVAVKKIAFTAYQEGYYLFAKSKNSTPLRSNSVHVSYKATQAHNDAITLGSIDLINAQHQWGPSASFKSCNYLQQSIAIAHSMSFLSDYNGADYLVFKCSENCEAELTLEHDEGWELKLIPEFQPYLYGYALYEFQLNDLGGDVTIEGQLNMNIMEPWKVNAHYVASKKGQIVEVFYTIDFMDMMTEPITLEFYGLPWGIGQFGGGTLASVRNGYIYGPITAGSNEWQWDAFFLCDINQSGQPIYLDPEKIMQGMRIVGSFKYIA